jgi:Protein of unknown function (DUF1364)
MSKITKSARGGDCDLRLPTICNWNPETTVWAHSPLHIHGGGMGMKCDDKHGCNACSACHDVLDGRTPRPEWMSRQLVFDYFDRAMKDARTRLVKLGLATFE